MTAPEAHYSAATTVGLPGWLVPAAGAAVVLGAVGTAVGLLGARPDETWWMLLVNFLYWTGLAQGMLVWSAIFRLTQTTWSPAVNRLGHATLGFQAFSLLMFALLAAGREHWLTWLSHPVPEKSGWLNAPFFFGRDAAALLLMAGLSAWLVAAYRKAEAASGEARRQAAYRINAVATALTVLYTLLYSLLAFDLVMSLMPQWYSTLLGGYYFTGNLYLAMAALVVAAALLRRPLGLTAWLGPRQFSDMGNLLLGFGLLTTGFFFAQYLTIWYGNLPEETSFIIPRACVYPWRGAGFVLLGACYLGPFLLLTFPRVKRNPRLVGPVAGLALVGMWIERWILVVPSELVMEHGSADRLAGLGLVQWAIPLMCAGVLTLVVTSALRRRPGVSPLDTELELSEGVAP